MSDNTPILIIAQLIQLILLPLQGHRQTSRVRAIWQLVVQHCSANSEPATSLGVTAFDKTMTPNFNREQANPPMPEVGTQKKRDIAKLIVSFLDRSVVYSAAMIEQIISENVRPSILNQRGYAPDHIRRAMIENGYVIRDHESNLTRVSEHFIGFDDCHRKRIQQYKTKAFEDPDLVEKCPICKRRFRIGALLNHYLKRHDTWERWEQVIEQYFGRS